MNKVQIDIQSFETLVRILGNQIKAQNLHINKIVCLSKGGLIPARYLAKFLEVDKIYVIGSSFYVKPGETQPKPYIYQHLTEDFDNDNILLVDDICDSGESIKVALKEIDEHGGFHVFTATIHYKNHSSFKPDLYAEEVPNDTWIDYFWE